MTSEKRKAVALRIAAIAAELFYHEGIHGVGVDRIAAKANITKRTLYRYYPSKDLLIAAALRHDLGLRFPRDGTPAQRLIGAFEFMATFLVENDYRGCPYINATAELVNRRHPGRAVVVEATARRRAWFRNRAVEAGVPDPELFAEQVDALFDGALASATKRADLAPIHAACAAVKTLLAASLPGTESFADLRTSRSRIARDEFQGRVTRNITTSRVRARVINWPWHR